MLISSVKFYQPNFRCTAFPTDASPKIMVIDSLGQGFIRSFQGLNSRFIMTAEEVVGVVAHDPLFSS
jgi:hypothetical protein